MKLFRPNGTHLWQSFWLLLALSPVVAGAVYTWQKHQWAQSVLDDAPPRIARLIGLLQSQSDIQKTLQQSQAFVGQHAYPAGQTPSEAGNDAQQRIRQAVTEAGLSVSSLQVQDPQALTHFDRIPLDLRAQGGLGALAKAMDTLQRLQPTVVVESINIQTLGPVRPDIEPNLNVQWQLAVYRSRS